MSPVASTGNLTLMAPRPAAKKSPAKKAAAPRKAPAKQAPAKKAVAKKAPARKAPAKKPAPAPAPNPTAGVYRLVRALWLGLAHAVGASFRGIGRGAKGLDPAHRKDGLALLLFALSMVVAAGTWASLRGPVGDLVEILVTGAFGRLDLLVPLLLGGMAVRLILHPERPEANGRIVIGLSALVIGVLGQVHIACGAPARSDGMQAIRDAGGLIGWGAATPLSYAMGDALAVPILVLLTFFGLLVVTATPVTAIPQRLRLLGVKLGIARPAGRRCRRRRPALRRTVARGAAALPAQRISRPRGVRPGRGRTGGALPPPQPPSPPLGAARHGPGAWTRVDVAAAAAAALDGAVLHACRRPPSSPTSPRA